MQGAGIDLGAAQQLGNLTAQGQTANQAGLTGALAGQTQLQQQQQAEINAPIQDALQRQGVLQSAVGAVPYGTTQNTTQNGPGATSNPWLTGLGALGTGASIAGTLAPLFSDRTMKTDIKRIGKDKETDLPLYAFRYKTDPKTYPKVVGIMAQDAQKDYPEQVVWKVGGKLAVEATSSPASWSAQMATPDQIAQFKLDNWQHALAVSQQTGVDPRIVMAQAGVESDWGGAAPGNNLFGVKGAGQTLKTERKPDLMARCSLRQHRSEHTLRLPIALPTTPTCRLSRRSERRETTIRRSMRWARAATRPTRTTRARLTPRPRE